MLSRKIVVNRNGLCIILLCTLHKKTKELAPPDNFEVNFVL